MSDVPPVEPAVEPGKLVDPGAAPPVDSVAPSLEAPKVWFGDFEPDLKGAVENKQWTGDDGPMQAVKAFVELERHLGAGPDGIIKKPAPDDKQGWEDLHKFLGRPDKAEDYVLKHADGVVADEGIESLIRAWAFESGVSSAGVTSLGKKWDEMVAARNAQAEEELETRDSTEWNKLRNKWGDKFDERLDLVQRTGYALGMTQLNYDDIRGVMGPMALAEWLSTVANTMGEDTITELTGTVGYGKTSDMMANEATTFKAEVMADPARWQAVMEGHGSDFAKIRQMEDQMLASATKG